MARSKSDILATEAMLQRLCAIGISREHAEALRRISMTLHRWHELECGDSSSNGAWAIVRGHKPARRDSMGNRLDGAGDSEVDFEHDDDGTPFMERHHYARGTGPDRVYYDPIADRERGALKRLASIMKHYPTLTPYVQGDPRGCALYILRPGDVPAGERADSYYSRGLAVHQ